MDKGAVIREYLVDRITLVIDNTEGLYVQACATAVEALRGRGVDTREEFAEATAGRGDYRREELEDEIGFAIADLVGQWVEEITDESMRLLVGDVLNLGDRALRPLLGARYWPEDGEVFDGDNEDEDGDE